MYDLAQAQCDRITKKFKTRPHMLYDLNAPEEKISVQELPLLNFELDTERSRE